MRVLQTPAKLVHPTLNHPTQFVHELKANGLACRRGDRIVFSGVGFRLANGGLLQVSGPNGTGKTSLLRLICGFLQPEAGDLRWDDSEVRSVNDEYYGKLAFVGHLNAVKDDLNALENLRFAAQLSGLASSESALLGALEQLGLAACRHLPGKHLSQGQKRRLALARLCLSQTRPLWVLDEPFAALDAAGIDSVRVLLEAHLAAGGMAVVTTHQDVPISAQSIERLELRP